MFALTCAFHNLALLFSMAARVNSHRLQIAQVVVTYTSIALPVSREAYGDQSALYVCDGNLPKA